ncbi:DUF4446 family protein [Paenibacillus hodogayensis]|uniref:DUF4446 family protein n=1 Tax=Paenibacillus hodogayensis TaxID=279208 RepID=A0ABV5W0N7_9BACL
MNEWSQTMQPEAAVALGLAAIIILLLIVLLIVSVKLSRLKKRYVGILGGLDIKELEQALMEYRQKTDAALMAADRQEERLQRIESTLKTMKSKIAVCRFNAFEERGADLSFSVAILSEQQDGVVLTGIHTRDETYVYAKPITGGTSEYKLTPEEKQAISQCLEPVEPK